MKEVMERKASDNAYLHKDFHGALSEGIAFVHRRLGRDAVRRYLRQFAEAFYAPLKRDLEVRGLVAMGEHFERIYRAEGGVIRVTASNGALRIEVESCPAVRHMRQHGYEVGELFHETTRTVGEVLCEGTPFAFVLEDYDPETGRGVQRFYRRPS